ncbi:unannotated protein [freshwater metagenome]|uniref:Unannotated protein n=1 Tax=freshwater metagenome TaxID=449393 RepID=A0A6J7UE79_9ZZZZ
MPFRSAVVNFAVPISMPLYSCIESALTTSALISLASETAKSLFPVAVAPQIIIKLI